MKRFTKITVLFATLMVALAFAGCENINTNASADTEKERPDYAENEKQNNGKSDGESENSDKVDNQDSEHGSADTEKNIATKWEYLDRENFLDDFLTFYSNGKVTLKTIYYYKGEYGKDVEDIDEFQGTYSGNTTKDGIISGEMEEYEGPVKINGVISGDTMKFWYNSNEQWSRIFTRVK